MRFNSFNEIIEYYSDKSPDSVALYYGIGDEKKQLSFSQLLSLINGKCKEFEESPKTSVGILCSNTKDCVITIFAAVKAGMQVVMLDESLNDSVLLEQINKADVDILWSEDAERINDLSPALTNGVEKNAKRILFFTSGTTSKSKAVVLTEQNLCSSAYNGSQKLPLTNEDILLSILPLSHVFGFVCGLLWGLSSGSAIALSRGPRAITTDFLFFQPTAVSLVPLLLGFFLKHKLFNRDLELILIGAGDCPDSLLDAARMMGKRVCFGYGLTETSSGVAISVSGDPHAMEICPDDEITIAEDGEVLISAPTCIMQGYYKDEKSTDEVLKNGIFYSGDIGYLDGEGKLHITGRKKEIIILPSGTKIFLPEYEGELIKELGNPELAVIMLSNRPALVIKEKEENREKVLATVNEVMKKHPRTHRISDVIFTDKPLPRTATGKIKRWEIRQTEEKKNG